MEAMTDHTRMFVEIDGETWFRIGSLEAMPEFFMTLASSGNHWFFISSLGALTAGRGSPDYAIFPYQTVDKIYDSRGIAGPVSSVAIMQAEHRLIWEPFADWSGRVWRTSRALYRNSIGSRVLFEERNHDLKLVWRASWHCSHDFGFIRTVTLQNESREALDCSVLDGFLNIMPAGVNRQLQSEYSCLADAYKDSVYDPDHGLACYGMAALLTDRSMPMEAFRASSVWYHGSGTARLSLLQQSTHEFRQSGTFVEQHRNRGQRGAFLTGRDLVLQPGQTETWFLVADIGQDHMDISRLRSFLDSPSMEISARLADESTRIGRELGSMVGRADGLSVSGLRLHSWHHTSNVLFNIMRGGLPIHGYRIDVEDFLDFVRLRHPSLVPQAARVLAGHSTTDIQELCTRLAVANEDRLASLGREYLPLSFSRRHGDPSRPWNWFDIRVRDRQGRAVLDHQGNWRDIFQNWEALALSHPGLLPGFIANFLGSMTLDGFNPYHIGRNGIAWEKVEPDNPWANIGYWNDHQVVYFQRLAELQEAVSPGSLLAGLNDARYPSALVPYRIADWQQLCRDPRTTIGFDQALDAQISAELAEKGSDARLVANADGSIQHSSLIQKILVILLAKTCSFAPGGGIWMNTQRPEWNDANNALVGNGLSLVTTAHLRRFVAFWQKILRNESTGICMLPAELAELLGAQAATIRSTGQAALQDDGVRFEFIQRMSLAGDAWRSVLYRDHRAGPAVAVKTGTILDFLDAVLSMLDLTLARVFRPDGLYDSYNLLSIDQKAGTATVSRLYPMLEGQVAILSSGSLTAGTALDLLEALPRSPLYRPDQKSYLLYPWRELPDFFHKNLVSDTLVETDPRLVAQLEKQDRDLLYRDVEGAIHFGAGLCNHEALAGACKDVEPATREALATLYETVFHHRAFTGRSGTMYAYEGLGSIYWHMVAKLLLSVMELRQSVERTQPDLLSRCDRAYLAVRDGIGYRKTAEVYGAFPWEPYSHTPFDGGARQPGMTGQVKEEIITRLGEFGLEFSGGTIQVRRAHLLDGEFTTEPQPWCLTDVMDRDQGLDLPAGIVACTVCQVPFIRHETAGVHGECRLRVFWHDGKTVECSGCLPVNAAREIFNRSGLVSRVEIR